MNLFGKKGIDTSYERDLFERRVRLVYPEKEAGVWLPSETMESIQRAREFSVTNVISGYEELLARIEELMAHIDSEMNGRAPFMALKALLVEKGYVKETIALENENSMIRDTARFELYTILYRLKKSITEQVDFQYTNYASQFIEGRSLEDLSLVENNSISYMAELENKQITSHVGHAHDEEEEIEDMEPIIRELNLLHITNGDIAYSHLNRQNDLRVLVDAIENNVYNYRELIGTNIESLIYSISGMENVEALKSNLLLSFQKLRQTHEKTKGQYGPISTNVEQSASEMALFEKKVKERATEDTVQWLYEQEEGVSESFDGLATLLVDGIKTSEKKYEEIHGSISQFYKSEAEFFAKQLQYTQDKQKYRLYFTLIEDIGVKASIDSKWVYEYLVSKGYEPVVDV